MWLGDGSYIHFRNQGSESQGDKMTCPEWHLPERHLSDLRILTPKPVLIPPSPRVPTDNCSRVNADSPQPVFCSSPLASKFPNPTNPPHTNRSASHSPLRKKYSSTAPPSHSAFSWLCTPPKPFSTAICEHRPKWTTSARERAHLRWRRSSPLVPPSLKRQSRPISILLQALPIPGTGPAPAAAPLTCKAGQASRAARTPAPKRALKSSPAPAIIWPSATWCPGRPIPPRQGPGTIENRAWEPSLLSADLAARLEQ